MARRETVLSKTATLWVTENGRRGVVYVPPSGSTNWCSISIATPENKPGKVVSAWNPWNSREQKFETDDDTIAAKVEAALSRLDDSEWGSIAVSGNARWSDLIDLNTKQ